MKCSVTLHETCLFTTSARVRACALTHTRIVISSQFAAAVNGTEGNENLFVES